MMRIPSLLGSLLAAFVSLSIMGCADTVGPTGSSFSNSGNSPLVPASTIEEPVNDQGDGDEDDLEEPGSSIRYDGKITSLRLIDLETNRTIVDFLETRAAVLNINELPVNYSVVATAESESTEVGSLVFGFEDQPSYRIESIAPYAISGDQQGRILRWNESFSLDRTYRISVTVYSGVAGEGDQGATISATLRFFRTVPPASQNLNPTILVLARGEQVPAAVHVSALPLSTHRPDLECGSRSFTGTVRIPRSVASEMRNKICDPSNVTVANRSYTRASQIANADQKEFECMDLATRQKLYACVEERDERYFESVAQKVLKQDNLVAADYQWDFGDPGSRFNQVRGMNASHVYYNPGTYRIRLQVRNARGEVGVDELSITIKKNSEPHSVYGPREVVYVSRNGSGNRNGSNASNSMSFSSLQQPIQNKLVYFKRGDEFAIGSGLSLGSNTALMAFGSTSLPRPKLVFHNPNPGFYNIFSLERAPRSILVKDLEVTSTPDSYRPRVMTFQGGGSGAQDIAILGLDIGRVSVFASSDSYATGVLIQDNLNRINPDLSRNTKDNFLYVKGRGYFIAGNDINIKIPQGVNEGEPLFRVCGPETELVNVYNNNFFNDVPRKDNIISLRNGQFFSVIGNRLQHGTMNVSADCAGKAWLKPPMNQRTSQILVDSNRMENMAFQIFSSVDRVMFRNNVLHHRAVDANYPSRRFFQIEVKSGEDSSPAPKNVQIFNNTSVLSRDLTKFLTVWSSAQGQIEFVNNLLFAENISHSPIEIKANERDRELKNFRKFSNNIVVTNLARPVIYNDGSKAFSDLNGARLSGSGTASSNFQYSINSETRLELNDPATRYQPSAGAPYIDEGINLLRESVEFDALGRERPKTSNAWAPGAFLQKGSTLGNGFPFPYQQFRDR